MDDEGQPLWLLLMVAAAFVLGLLVMAVNDDYRFDSIIESNRNYYPSVPVESP